MLSRRQFLAASTLAGAHAVTGAARRAAAQQTPKRGGTLRVGFYIEAATMDPPLSGSKVDRQVYHNIYEPPGTLDAGSRRNGWKRIEGKERPPWSDVTSTGTFTIRPGQTFDRHYHDCDAYWFIREGRAVIEIATDKE